MASDFYVHTKYVSVTTLEFTPSHTVLRVGRLPTVLLLRTHTCSPIDRTVPDGHGAASYPEVTPLDDSPALRTLCIDRTCSHTTTHANVPQGGLEHKGQHLIQPRAHASTSSLWARGGQLPGSASSQHACLALCRSSPPPRAARARNSSCSRPSRCTASTRPDASTQLVAQPHALSAAASPPLAAAVAP